MRGHEVRAAVRELVHLDDDETRDEEVEREAVEGGVGERALLLLRGRVRGLQDQDGLDDGEERGGVQEWVRGEEDEGLKEDVGPHGGYEEEDAGLGEDGGAW